jgi:hypothetical protein
MSWNMENESIFLKFKLFSQREGLKPLKQMIQIDSVDEDLKNDLWNCFFNFVVGNSFLAGFTFVLDNKMYRLGELLWLNYFKQPLDTLSNDPSKIYKYIRDYFFDSKREWYEIYDFIEFVVNVYPNVCPGKDKKEFINACNMVLERELSAYRFVGEKIIKITSEIEIKEIEEALENTKNIDKLKPVNEHLKRAIELLSDRKSPDYRNSIKESISSLESLCKIIINKKDATLSEALDKMRKEKIIDLHPALNEALNKLYEFGHKLYGYASDFGGIRHGKSDPNCNVNFEDAKFMLLCCSSYINYLIVKASKLKIL